MTTMPTNVIRLWELDDTRAPAHLVGSLALEADGMGSFVELSHNYTEPDSFGPDGITVYPPHEVDSITVKLIGDVATRFDFDTSRGYALEVWAKITSGPDDCDPGPDRWAYLVIPAMRRPTTRTPWRVLVPGVRDNPDTDPVTREVDEVMTRNEQGELVTAEGATYGSQPMYPVVCFRTDRAGHKWGTGPAPTAYTAEGTPAFLPGPLEPSSMYLQMLTNMSPADALEYPKATEDA